MPQDETREPSENKVPTKTSVTTIFKETIVSEGDEEGRFRGSDISHPYKSPEIEGISLVADTDKPRRLSENTEPIETKDRGTFKGSDVSRPYKAPDIERITSKTTVTVITDSVPSKQDEDEETKEEKEGKDTFHGSDISHPYKSPEIEDISLVKDVPKEERKEPTPKTPTDTRPVETLREREIFKGSDISHPYKSPDIEGISLIQEIPKEEPSEGKVITKTTVTTVVTDSVPVKQEEDKEPEEEKEARDRFHGSDISHPYKSPEIEDISLVKDVPKDERKEPTPETPTDTRPVETLRERETFKGSDILHSYKSPDIEGISLVQEIPKEEPSEGKVISKTTVTTDGKDSVPSKEVEDQEPKEEEDKRDRFRGSDISHPYKSPEIEDIRLSEDLDQSEDREKPEETKTIKSTVTTVISETIVAPGNDEGKFPGTDFSRPYKSPEIEDISLVKNVPKDERKEPTPETPTDTRPVETLRERETFKGSDISHPYKSPDIEGISLVQEIPKEEPSEGKVISKTTVTTVVPWTDSVPVKQEEDKEPEEEKEARDRFNGSDISHPYTSPEIEGITLVTDVPKDEREEREKEVLDDAKPAEIPEDREKFKGSDISHPYKSPDIEGISLVQEIPKEEPSEGKVMTKTTVTTVVTDSVPSKEVEDQESKEEKEARDRFRGSDISHPYKSPEIESIPLTMDDRSEPTEDRGRSETTVTTVVTEVSKPIEDNEKDRKEDRDVFHGSDISHPYKSPNIEGISLVQKVPTDDKPAKVHEEILPPKKEEIDDKTEKDVKQGFQGGSDISIEYKAPKIEDISLISDVKEDKKTNRLKRKSHMWKKQGAQKRKKQMKIIGRQRPLSQLLSQKQ